MCGILGVVVNRMSVDVVRNLYDLFDYQKNRGIDGGGISINNESLLRFRSYSPFRIFAIYNSQIWRQVKNGSRVMIHHRFPTSTPNAPRFNHPLQNEDKNIHLIHNGIISNDDALFKTLSPNHTFETKDNGKYTYTDSEVLVHLFEEHFKDDVITTLKKVADDTVGSFAVAMQLEGDKNIYLLRHSNPIVISKDKDDNYYFSSELDNKEKSLTLVHTMKNGEIGTLSAEGYKKFIEGKDEPEYSQSTFTDYDFSWKKKSDWKYWGYG